MFSFFQYRRFITSTRVTSCCHFLFSFFWVSGGIVLSQLLFLCRLTKLENDFRNLKQLEFLKGISISFTKSVFFWTKKKHFSKNWPISSFRRSYTFRFGWELRNIIFFSLVYDFCCMLPVASLPIAKHRFFARFLCKIINIQPRIQLISEVKPFRKSQETFFTRTSSF